MNQQKLKVIIFTGLWGDQRLHPPRLRPFSRQAKCLLHSVEVMLGSMACDGCLDAKRCDFWDSSRERCDASACSENVGWFVLVVFSSKVWRCSLKKVFFIFRRLEATQGTYMFVSNREPSNNSTSSPCRIFQTPLIPVSCQAVDACVLVLRVLYLS